MRQPSVSIPIWCVARTAADAPLKGTNRRQGQAPGRDASTVGAQMNWPKAQPTCRSLSQSDAKNGERDDLVGSQCWDRQ